MKYPLFFEAIEEIRLYDALSEALGTFENGIVSFTYLDVVKNAGHSCPTIAGAYLSVREGLKALYEGKMPERGNIAVFFRDAKEQGTTGVVANVFSLISGATDTWGFKGIGTHFSRTNRLFFQANIATPIQIERLDTHQSVGVTYDPSCIQGDLRLPPLMNKLAQESLSFEEKTLFQTLWQERVRKILENFDKVITLNLD